MAIEIKILGALWSYQLNSTANLANLAQFWGKWAGLAVLFIWYLQKGSKDFAFFNCHGCWIFFLCETHCYFCPHILWVYYFRLSQCVMGRDSLVSCDKGTEVQGQRDIGTSSKSYQGMCRDEIVKFCHGTGRDRMALWHFGAVFWQSVLFRSGTGHRTEGKKESEKNPFPV